MPLLSEFSMRMHRLYTFTSTEAYGCLLVLIQRLLMFTGTFLYVAFMEVIPRELAVPHHRTAKLAMLMLGFGAMSLLAIWA